MSDDEESNIDLTLSSPVAPLLAPITVSNRSLRPRQRQRISSAEARARSFDVSSRSRSRSGSGSSQLLYPEDPDSSQRSADSPAQSPRRLSIRSEESTDPAKASRTNTRLSISAADDARSDSGSRAGKKRRRSPSPVASSSRSGPHKGKRRAARDTGTCRRSRPSCLL